MTGSPARLLVFAGSLRAASHNKRLARYAATVARDAGAEVTYVELNDYPMPLLDQDFEKAHGLPEPARQLRDLALATDGYLISCPEYNGSMTGVFKNTIDWLSRGQPDKLSPFRGHVAGLLAASPGRLGGIRGLEHARAVLFTLGTTVVPPSVGIPAAAGAFDDDGALSDEGARDRVATLVANVIAAVNSQP